MHPKSSPTGHLYLELNRNHNYKTYISFDKLTNRAFVFGTEP